MRKAIGDSGAILLGDEIGQAYAALDALAHIGEEGAVGIGDAPLAVNRRNADRRAVEKAGKAHLGVARRLFGLARRFAVENERADHAPPVRATRPARATRTSREAEWNR